MRRTLLALPLAAVMVPAAALAADPESGTVSNASPKVEWTGTSTAGGLTTIPAVANGGTVACLPESCDTFALTVADSADLLLAADAPNTGGFTMLEVVLPDESTQYAMGAEDETRTTLKLRNAPVGEYEVRIAANALTPVDYSASAELSVPPPPAAPPPAPAPAQPPSSSPSPAAQPPTVSITAGRLSARRAVKAKVSSSGPVTDVVAELRRGRRVVARARLARLDGTRTLRLRAIKRVKPGKHVLAIAAKSTDGQTVGATRPVRVRR